MAPGILRISTCFGARRHQWSSANVNNDPQTLAPRAEKSWFWDPPSSSNNIVPQIALLAFLLQGLEELPVHALEPGITGCILSTNFALETLLSSVYSVPRNAPAVDVSSCVMEQCWQCHATSGSGVLKNHSKGLAICVSSAACGFCKDEVLCWMSRMSALWSPSASTKCLLLCQNAV